jgi:hypothetical protein
MFKVLPFINHFINYNVGVITIVKYLRGGHLGRHRDQRSLLGRLHGRHPANWHRTLATASNQQHRRGHLERAPSALQFRRTNKVCLLYEI